MKKHITILVLVGLIIAVASYFIFRDTTPEPMGATGSSFNLEHEYIYAGASGGATTTTTTYMASTTPLTFTGESTTTVTVLTAGVSDLRLNMIAHATGGSVEGEGPIITIEKILSGNNKVDRFYETEIATSGFTRVLSPVHTYYWDAQATTTRTTTLSPESDNFSAASFQISNINVPWTVLDIGVSTTSSFYVEIVKVIPR